VTPDVPTPPADNTSNDALKTVVENYYKRGVEAADRERDRAERGYTIASAIAAALVAAGVFGHLDEKSDLVKALGLAALFAWVCAAMLFVWAVSAPTAELAKPAGGGWTTAGEFMAAVSSQAERDRNEIRRRARTATLTTLVAIAITFAAFSFGVTEKAGPGPQHAMIGLSLEGRRALVTVCTTGLPTQITGMVDVGSLEENVVAIKLDPNVCSEEAVDVEVPRRYVLAVSLP
jgi:hypothetical protein